MDGSKNISFSWKLGYQLLSIAVNFRTNAAVLRGLFLPGGNTGHVMLPIKIDPEQIQIPKKWTMS